MYSFATNAKKFTIGKRKNADIARILLDKTSFFAIL